MTDARARMLAQIRGSLAVNRDHLLAQAAAFPAPHPRGPFVESNLAPIEQFTAGLSALHASVHVCDGRQAALGKVHELLESVDARQVLTWATNELPLPEVSGMLESLGVQQVDRQVLDAADREAQLGALDPVPVCISGVDAAIAESGSMIMVSGPGRGRLASLLPPMHIALLPAERIVRTLPEAFDALRERFGDSLFGDRSNVTIITGPSRTADIELSLTLGVHGPSDVHAVVIC
jgi:L-lactate dehydrogenase complex protein LldG